MNQAVKGGRLPRVVGRAKRAAILGADVGAGPASEVPPEVAEAARAAKIKAPWDCKESIRGSGREGHESSKAESDPRRGMGGQLTRKQRDEPSKALDAQEAAAKKRLPHRTVGFGGKVYGVPRGRALRRWRSKGGPLAGPLLSDMRMSLNAARLAGVGVPGPDLGLRGLRGTGERRSRGLGVTGTRERALTAGQNKAGAIPETASACGASARGAVCAHRSRGPKQARVRREFTSACRSSARGNLGLRASAARSEAGNASTRIHLGVGPRRAGHFGLRAHVDVTRRAQRAGHGRPTPKPQPKPEGQSGTEATTKPKGNATPNR